VIFDLAATGEAEQIPRVPEAHRAPRQRPWRPAL
jgi:hypothetical protein